VLVTEQTNTTVVTFRKKEKWLTQLGTVVPIPFSKLLTVQESRTLLWEIPFEENSREFQDSSKDIDLEVFYQTPSASSVKSRIQAFD
jgi:hypothetical protein